VERNTRALYDLEIYRLKEGEHRFELPINDAFFEIFGGELVETGSGRAEILLDKSSRMLSLHVNIQARVRLECDRSLEPFDHPLDIQDILYVKYGEEEEELDENLLVITENTQRINVAQYLYDLIGLSLPMKRIHPDYRTEEDDDWDDTEDILVYQSGAKEEQEPDTAQAEEDKNIDPRWQGLKDLKFNSDNNE
jgi:uncharacterized protein